MEDKLPELIEKIELAGFGRHAWDDILEDIRTLVPGSWIALYGTDPSNMAKARIQTTGIDQSMVEAYARHFAALNPWNVEWMQPGPVKSSLQIKPADQVRHTEFYNDFLRPAGNCFDAVGLRIDSEPGFHLSLAVQMDKNRAEQQDPHLVRLLRQLHNPLLSAMWTNTMQLESAASFMSAAALSGRSVEAAIVVDERRCIRDANEAGLAMLESGKFLASRSGRLEVRDRSAGVWLRSTIRALHLRDPAGQADHAELTADGRFRLRLMRLPGLDERYFLANRSLHLLLVRNLGSSGQGLPERVLATSFGMVPSEIRVCQLLLAGLSLREIAEHLANSEHTIKAHLKSVFRKTGVNRQAELLILLTRLG